MKVQEYQTSLRSLPALTSETGQQAWRAYLIEHSGLPGPRGNLELAQAVALEGSEALFLGYLADYSPQVAPVNTPQEYLAFCGALGLGRLVAEGERQYLALLRHYASDPRWRTREAVAMALQNWADPPTSAVRNINLLSLLELLEGWSDGNFFEQRAVVAAICEPRLLVDPAHAKRIFDLLDKITHSLSEASDRRDEGFQALRKALGYGWSVAVAAYPESGKPVFSSWLSSHDKDVRWAMKENLKKNRLIRVDAAWVSQCTARLGE
jgi:hypothetical protein